jgi:purine-binding chemotaxis protein CheW
MKISATRKKAEETVEERMFVTVLLGENKFGVDVTKVQEIMGIPELAHIPNARSYMKGVTNLRGNVIPLVDLRIKFNMPEKEYDRLTVVMISEIKGMQIGLIVDSVQDVINMPISSIQDTPHFSTDISADCIQGVGKMDENIIVMIDVDRIFSEEELAQINK